MHERHDARGNARLRLSGLAFCILTFCASCGRPGSEPAPPPNVLLITIDTLRADRLGVALMPAIDRLAERGVRFSQARAAAPLTLPSHTTIMTGLLPPAHGVRENGLDALAGTHVTVARLLKEAGYQTAAFVGAFVLDRRFGLSQGFDTYDDRIARDPNATDRLEAERPASAVVDAALAWLGSTQHPAPGTAPSTPAPGTAPSTPAPGTAPSTPAPGTQHPFFAWIHLYDPHAPYSPPAEFLNRARSATSHQPPATDDSMRYDAEVSYADSQIARVFDWLHAQRLDESTLIAVAGDHGEGLGDHGERTHGMLLYDATLRVPLVIAVPGPSAATRASTVDEAVSLVDLAPTLLRATGLTPPVEMAGRNLLDLVRPKADTATGNARAGKAGPVNGSVRLQPDSSGGRQPDLYSETEYPRAAGWSPLQALTDGRWMTIHHDTGTELYDLQHDPQETRDVASAQGGIAAAMSARIARLYTPAGGAKTLSADTAERLRSLGYVAGAPQSAAAGGAPNPSSRVAAWSRFEDALALLNAHRPEAVGDLQRLAKEFADAPVFVTTSARALKEAGRTAAALGAYRDAAKRWPTDATLLHDLAVAARDAANASAGAAAAALRDEAARAERAAIVLSPGSAAAHNGLGLIAADADRPQDAEPEFTRATELDPTNAPYWANLGNARRARGDRAGAEHAYRRALDADARAADAANGLGVLLVEAGRASEAVTWFEHALTAAPDLAEARLNLGIALQQSGQPARAADAYRAVLAAQGEHPRERDAAKKLLGALGAGR